MEGIEQKSLNNSCYYKKHSLSLSDKPLLFEQIIQYLSDSLDIEGESIKLIGSAKQDFLSVLLLVMVKNSQIKVIWILL